MYNFKKTDTTWQSLPKEILSAIFVHINDSNDLLQLQLVCTSWSVFAYQNLYRSITLDDYTVELLKSKFKPWFYVSSIKFPDDVSYSKFGYGVDYLDILVRLCPNIVRVEASNDEGELYKALLFLHGEGYLQHIQYLPDYAYHDAVDIKNLYGFAATSMRKTLVRVFFENINYPADGSIHFIMSDYLVEFPRLKELELAFTASSFFYEMDTIIERCGSALKTIRMLLANTESSLRKTTFPALNLDKVMQRPQVKSLHIGVSQCTTRDLQFIMHKFTGLEKLVIENEGFEDDEAARRLIANGLLSTQVYLDTFAYLITLSYFEACRLSILTDIKETLAFWSRHSQLKAMVIGGAPVIAEEDVLFTVMNCREGEGEFSQTSFEHKEDGAWEMKLDIYYHDFAAIYKQTLEQFRGNTIQHIQLLLWEPSEIEMGGVIGDSLGYIIDHYTAVKEILLEDARLSSFEARTVDKHLKRLKLYSCSINPDAMLQLSSSISHINKLIIDRSTMLNNTPNDCCFYINMPHTSFGVITVWCGNAESALIMLCKSPPDGSGETIMRYYDVGTGGCLEIDENVYNRHLAKKEVDRLYNVIVIHYQNLDTLIIPGKYECTISVEHNQ
ncbi:hypothetical protein MBANPS3_011240 [Mucor bainieri]